MSGKGQLARARMRYEQSLAFFGENPKSSFEHLMVAICLTQLERYQEAMRCFGLAFQASLEDQFWHGSSQPNWLVDTCILSNQPDLYPLVLKEVEAYKLDPRGGSLVALYAYAMVRLLSGKDEEARSYVPGLLKDRKIKWTFAVGKALEGILESKQQMVDAAIDGLLKAHRGMAKYGGLRETPEGYLCLPAMSLSKVALERSMEVNAESEYLSKGYLDYLMQDEDASS
jgi:tetratricopeptide (TPR) repeat protein